ncbi:hypothetical protein F5887DRAFT_1286410 [Amanita rubescens]|nr:hypothetical protein F5887DRAFT_1286410 [Amanita rubescens]
MERINGTVARAGAAVELVKSKQKKDEREEGGAEVRCAEGAGVDDETRRERRGRQRGGREGNRYRRSERVAAVDWALSKDRWEEEKAKMESESEEGNADNSSSDCECQYEEGEEESGWGAHDQEASGDESNDETSSDQSEDERDED